MATQEVRLKCLLCGIIVLVLSLEGLGILHYEKLSKIGLVKGITRKYKIKSNPLTKDIVIKMIPNVSNVSKCTGTVMENYKSRLTGILSPIKGAIELYNNNTHDLVGDVKLAGVVMAGIAIGIATAAQITAGVALYEAMKNADNINKLKSSIESTNEAVVKLQETAEKTVYVLTALQDYINTNLVPTIDQISCKQTELALDLALSKYLLICSCFGPNLQDPVSNSMTIQAISQAFGGNYETLLRTLGYATEDFDDLLESDSITGQIVYVDLSSYYIIVRVYFPILTEIQQAYVQELLPVSFNNDNSEWISIVPNFVLIRNTLISNIEVKYCLITKKSVICNQDYATPMTASVRECLTGSTDKCPRELVVSSHVPRFALSGGVLFANCISVTCQCQTTGRAISQSREQTLLMIDNTTCTTVVLGNIIISLPKYLGSIKLQVLRALLLGHQSIQTKVDISSQISSMNQSLQQSKDYIKEAQKILDTVNPSLISMLSMIILYVLSIAALCIGLITFISFVIVEKKRGNYSRLDDRQVRPVSNGDLYYIGT
nr:fusion protein [Henipavirus hendraense]